MSLEFLPPNAPGATLHASNAPGATFHMSNTAGATFHPPNPPGATFHTANALGATFHTANALGATFQTPNVSSATFHAANPLGAISQAPICAKSNISQFRNLPNFQLRHAPAPHAYVHVYAPGPLLRVMYLPSKLRGTPLSFMYTFVSIHAFDVQ